ncbi:MAG: sulfur carrier protein ThiS adenylyltransferase ThiF [Thermoplasmata archaeon]|nr:sulfur carrier protein ThiS adenylyltransferase ThiF [Thermoplasmata archaeon]
MDDPIIARRLKKASVGIAGAGGLGSNVAMALARAGIGHLVIVDFDIVEEKNLNRQQYFLDQVGQYKVEALKHNIARAVRGCMVEAIKLKLEKGKMTGPFEGVDVVVEALDSAEAKAGLIEEVLMNLPGKPIVAASGVAGYGHSERVFFRRSGDLYLVQDEEAKSSDEDVLLAPKVGLFAYYQANTVLELLLGVEK